MKEDEFFSRAQRFPMPNAAKMRVFERLQAADTSSDGDAGDNADVTLRRYKRRHHLATTAAGVVAVIIAGTVVVLLQQAGKRDTVASTAPKHTHVKPVAPNSYRALLGFVPLLPAVQPKDVVSESTKIQLVNVDPVPAHTSKAPHPMKQFEMRFTLKNSAIPHLHELIIDEESAASAPFENVNPSTTVTVDGYGFGKAEVNGPSEYYIIKNGIFFGVWGIGITTADQLKVLKSLQKPVTGTPAEVTRLEYTERAISRLPFAVIKPTMPKGYARAGAPIVQIETTKHGQGETASYFAQYHNGTSPNLIEVYEWIDRQSGLKALPAIKGQKETVNGQTVYYDSADRQYSWKNPDTNVCFQVGGGVDTPAAAHKQLRAIVTSLIQ